ncbi:glycosyltransferase family 4 protein [Calderihabitans maritimus]|uniref:Group 1 glycosyl transferase n=1 Tax=Calderihabitans maritimus TaxID=1246530 RepID=A0A1Z5HXG7_9FIRM|nr:glycosyltransferase family 4 protein [Calderihabitans maritimus]GAW94005.1 group 1 glycosyl transferase [Calderihabitans maritimus]
MKKVCIITSVHPWNDIRIFHKQAKSLAAKYEVQLHGIAPFYYKKVDGIDVFGLPSYSQRWKRPLNWLRLLGRTLKSGASVVHFHDPELIPLGIVLRCLGKKVIYDVHENYPLSILSKEWLPVYLRKFVAAVFKLVEKIAAIFFNRVVAVTPDIASNFKKGDVVVIKNYPLVIDDLIKEVEFKRNQEIHTLIFVGLMRRVRGIAELVKSLDYLSPKHPVKLQLVGSFADEEFAREIEELSRGRNVELLGQVSHREAIGLMVKATVGLLCFHPAPNHLTAMPNKMFEYMGAGLPIVASDFPHWRKIVQQNRCGVTVNPLNPADIARGIEYLLNNPDLREEMGRNGHKAYLERYNWLSQERILLETYEKLFD